MVRESLMKDASGLAGRRKRDFSTACSLASLRDTSREELESLRHCDPLPGEAKATKKPAVFREPGTFLGRGRFLRA
jgi:hypothetical protein